MAEQHPPSISETAFDCPHCGAYTSQEWRTVHIQAWPEKGSTPFDPRSLTEELEKSNEEQKNLIQSIVNKFQQGVPYFEKRKSDSPSTYKLNNANISVCYNCEQCAIWIADKLIYPAPRHGTPPSEYLPKTIIGYYNEALEIVNSSPRGAAALLRLALQVLCKEVGEPGKDLNSDIANLVKNKGLSPQIQRSLDIVRVIGNEAVHPGTIDLNDDTSIAHQLFTLINLIAEQVIGLPKKINQTYEKLPEEKRKSIEQRDKK